MAAGDGLSELLRECFEVIDADSSGAISMEEFRTFIDAQARPCTEAELRELFTRVDRDSSGEIDQVEFVELVELLERKLCISVSTMAKAFETKCYETLFRLIGEGASALTTQELRGMVDSVNESLKLGHSSEDLRKIFSKYDEAKGRIEMIEFVDIVNQIKNKSKISSLLYAFRRWKEAARERMKRITMLLTRAANTAKEERRSPSPRSQRRSTPDPDAPESPCAACARKDAQIAKLTQQLAAAEEAARGVAAAERKPTPAEASYLKHRVRELERALDRAGAGADPVGGGSSTAPRADGDDVAMRAPTRYEEAMAENAKLRAALEEIHHKKEVALLEVQAFVAAERAAGPAGKARGGAEDAESTSSVSVLEQRVEMERRRVAQLEGALSSIKQDEARRGARDDAVRKIQVTELESRLHDARARCGELQDVVSQLKAKLAARSRSPRRRPSAPPAGQRDSATSAPAARESEVWEERFKITRSALEIRTAMVKALGERVARGPRDNFAWLRDLLHAVHHAATSRLGTDIDTALARKSVFLDIPVLEGGAAPLQPQPQPQQQQQQPKQPQQPRAYSVEPTPTSPFMVPPVDARGRTAHPVPPAQMLSAVSELNGLGGAGGVPYTLTQSFGSLPSAMHSVQSAPGRSPDAPRSPRSPHTPHAHGSRVAPSSSSVGRRSSQKVSFAAPTSASDYSCSATDLGSLLADPADASLAPMTMAQLMGEREAGARGQRTTAAAAAASASSIPATDLGPLRPGAADSSVGTLVHANGAYVHVTPAAAAAAAARSFRPLSPEGASTAGSAMPLSELASLVPQGPDASAMSGVGLGVTPAATVPQPDPALATPKPRQPSVAEASSVDASTPDRSDVYEKLATAHYELASQTKLAAEQERALALARQTLQQVLRRTQGNREGEVVDASSAVAATPVVAAAREPLRSRSVSPAGSVHHTPLPSGRTARSASVDGSERPTATHLVTPGAPVFDDRIDVLRGRAKSSVPTCVPFTRPLPGFARRDPPTGQVLAAAPPSAHKRSRSAEVYRPAERGATPVATATVTTRPPSPFGTSHITASGTSVLGAPPAIRALLLSELAATDALGRGPARSSTPQPPPPNRCRQRTSRRRPTPTPCRRRTSRRSFRRT